MKNYVSSVSLQIGVLCGAESPPYPPPFFLLSRLRNETSRLGISSENIIMLISFIHPCKFSHSWKCSQNLMVNTIFSFGHVDYFSSGQLDYSPKSSFLLSTAYMLPKCATDDSRMRTHYISKIFAFEVP